MSSMTGRAMSADGFHFDPAPKSLEILHVVRQQYRDTVGQHGGHDIGVMDLFAAAGYFRHQIEQLRGDGVGVVGDLEAFDEQPHLLQHGSSGDGGERV